MIILSCSYVTWNIRADNLDETCGSLAKCLGKKRVNIHYYKQQWLMYTEL